MSTYRPGEAAQQLGIAAPTLRRYSVQFAAHLSPSASAAVAQGGGALERRYTARDIATLKRASGLLARGLTFDQVKQQLGQADDAPAPAHQITLTPDTGLALVELVSARGETIAAQRETIALLHAEVERLKADLERQQQRYMGIIRKLVERTKEKPLEM